MIETRLLLLPVIGFVIGYFTNYLAVKMLFHPRRQFFGIQGVIPKRKQILAKKIGEVSPEIMPSYFKKIESIPAIGPRIMNSFQNAVENQINSLSVDELEKIVFRVAKKELRFIEIIGGVIGFIIGCLQILIMIV